MPFLHDLVVGSAAHRPSFLCGRVRGMGSEPQETPGTGPSPQNGHSLHHSLSSTPQACPCVQTVQLHQDPDYKAGDLGSISDFPVSPPGDPWQVSLSPCPQMRIPAWMRYKLQGTLKITEARNGPHHSPREFQLLGPAHLKIIEK